MKRLLMLVLVLALVAGSAYLGWTQITAAENETAYERQVLSAVRVTGQTDPAPNEVIIPLLPGRMLVLPQGRASLYAYIAAGAALALTGLFSLLQRVHPARVITAMLAQIFIIAAGAGLSHLVVTQMRRMLGLVTLDQFFAWQGALPITGAMLALLLAVSGLCSRGLIRRSTYPISAAYGAMLTLALATAAAARYQSDLVGLFGVPLAVLTVGCLITTFFVRWRTAIGLVLFAPFVCLSLMQWLPAAYAVGVTAGLTSGYLPLFVLAGVGFTSLFMGMSLMADAGAVPAPRREEASDPHRSQPKHAAVCAGGQASPYAKPTATDGKPPRHRRSERYH